jgi:transposase-like protein
MVTNTTHTTGTELVETGEKRDRLGRKITPVARRAELVAAWRESGLTQAEFARREGITYSSFAAWVQAERRVAEGGSRAAKPAIRPPQRVNFTEVRLPATAGSAPSLGLEVRLPDGTVLRGGSGAELAKLVRALRA